MGILDRLKKGKVELEKSQSSLRDSKRALQEANDKLSAVLAEDEILNNRFAGKLFRGKLIDNVKVVEMPSGETILKIFGRVISFDEYLNNSYDNLIEDDDWLSGAFAVYGGVSDRKWWDRFVGSVAGYSGISADDNNASSNRLFSVSSVSDTVRSLSFTRDEKVVLKNIIEGELGLRGMFPFPVIEGFVDKDILKEAWDRVVDVLVVEVDKRAAEHKRWYLFREEGSKEVLVELCVKMADKVVDDIVSGK